MIEPEASSTTRNSIEPSAAAPSPLVNADCLVDVVDLEHGGAEEDDGLPRDEEGLALEEDALALDEEEEPISIRPCSLGKGMSFDS